MTGPRAPLGAGSFCTGLFPIESFARWIGLAALSGACCTKTPNAVTGKRQLSAKQFVKNYPQTVYIGGYRKPFARHLLRTRMGEREQMAAGHTDRESPATIRRQHLDNPKVE